MKFRKMMFAGLALTMLTACSQEEELEVNGGNSAGEGDAYMSLSISMPKSGLGGRAITEGSGQSAGTIDEQKVKTLTVYVWGENKGPEAQKGYVLTYVKKYSINDLKPTAPAPGSDLSTVYTTDVFKVKSGISKVVAIVNGGTLFNESTMGAVGSPFNKEDFRGMKDVKDVSTISTGEYGFLMTNAFNISCIDENGGEITSEATVDNQFNTDGTVFVNIQGTKRNPTTVIVPVERAVAKLDEVSKSLNREVEGTQSEKGKDQVHFTHIALINGNKKFYPIKKVRTSNDKEGGDYIVDPNFSGQATLNLDNHFHPRNFRGEGNNVEVGNLKWVALSTEDNPTKLDIKNEDVFYTLENTMIKDEQNNAYTTGFYYKAVYQLAGKEKGVSVYRFQGKLYDWTDVQAVPEFPEKLKNQKEPTISACEEYGIVKYENGICYYPYWIRHINNKKPEEMGVMEFGVVRNNWYQMELGKVSGIGTNKPVDPTPENPDETVETQLEVIVKVRPWTVRENIVDF